MLCKCYVFCPYTSSQRPFSSRQMLKLALGLQRKAGTMLLTFIYAV